jgi:hypothetical protein
MSNGSATQTYQQGVQNLQGWLDFLDGEEAKLEAQLLKMQGGNAAPLPQIDADLPEIFDDERALPELSQDSAEDIEKWT